MGNLFFLSLSLCYSLLKNEAGFFLTHSFHGGGSDGILGRGESLVERRDLSSPGHSTKGLVCNVGASTKSVMNQPANKPKNDDRCHEFFPSVVSFGLWPHCDSGAVFTGQSPKARSLINTLLPVFQLPPTVQSKAGDELN